MRHEATSTLELCPARDHLASLLTEELPADASSRLEDHLASCTSCQATLLELSGNLDLDPCEVDAQTGTGGSDTTIEEPRPEFLERLANLALIEPGKTTVTRQSIAEAAGLVLPGIDIFEQIGRGSLGTVYLAQQKGINRLIALKAIPVDRLSNEQDRERAHRGVEAVARLDHPNIIKIYNVARHERWFYGTLEYMEGGSLKERLTGAPWAPRDAAQLILTLARAAAFVHEKGFLHRDLKPANVLFKADGTPKLADFGLARSFAEDSNLTLDGEALGTPRYMAPEQAMGKQSLGPGADIYALGAILYELLSGRPPFRGATKLDTLYQVVHLPPVPVGRLQPDVPCDLARICMRCLEKASENRYASAGELADDLGRFLESKPIRSKPFGLLRRARTLFNNHPLLSFVALVLLLVAILECIGIQAMWMEMENGDRRNSNQVVQADTSFYAAQLAHTQSELATALTTLAEQEIKSGDKVRASAALFKVPPNLRDARWEKLHAQCQGREEGKN